MHAAVQPVKVPWLAVADVIVQHQRLILRKDAHRVDARVHTVRQREIDDAVLSAERHGGFCQLSGKRVQARALAAGQQHGNTFFHNSLPLLSPLRAFYPASESLRF